MFRNQKEAIFFLFVACCYGSEVLCSTSVVRDFRVCSWYSPGLQRIYCLLQMTVALRVTKSRCKSCTFRSVKFSNWWVFNGGLFLPIIIDTTCVTGKMKQQLQTIFLKWSSSCINAEWFSRKELQRSKNERKWMQESARKLKGFVSKEQCQSSTRT